MDVDEAFDRIKAFIEELRERGFEL